MADEATEERVGMLVEGGGASLPFGFRSPRETYGMTTPNVSSSTRMRIIISRTAGALTGASNLDKVTFLEMQINPN